MTDIFLKKLFFYFIELVDQDRMLDFYSNN